MALFIVVHHREDIRQPWRNSWLDDERLRAITTTPQIGHMCEDSALRGERVFVHRCTWGEHRPSVVCSVEVDRVDAVDRRTSLVTFQDEEVIGVPPPRSPQLGQNFYEAEAV